MSNATWSSLNERACFTRDSRTIEWDYYMSRPSAPSMPTPKQVREARDLVLSIDPNAKILRVGLAFEHSTPDASLPIFFSERDNWSPLVTRR